MTRRRNNKAKTLTISIVLLVALVVWLVEQVDIPTIQANEAQSVLDADNAEQPSIENPHLELASQTTKPEQIIEHTGYTVSYHPYWYIPNWVAYELTDAEVDGLEERSNHFVPDPLVKGDPVVTKDYSNSGYDRGHMAPAADMKWSEQAMKESFYMTNMCPQNHSCNAGDWKDLEEFGRDLARKYKSIYICCGPIVTDTTTTIGLYHRIVVPQSFFKAFLRQKVNGEWTCIGFIMPNAPGNRPLMTYMVPVDDVEKQTGIDLFYQLSDSIEKSIEKDFNISDWTL